MANGFLNIMDLDFSFLTWRDSEEIPLMVAEHNIYLVHTHIGWERGGKYLQAHCHFVFTGYLEATRLRKEAKIIHSQ